MSKLKKNIISYNFLNYIIFMDIKMLANGGEIKKIKKTCIKQSLTFRRQYSFIWWLKYAIVCQTWKYQETYTTDNIMCLKIMSCKIILLLFAEKSSKQRNQCSRNNYFTRLQFITDSYRFRAGCVPLLKFIEVNP